MENQTKNEKIIEIKKIRKKGITFIIIGILIILLAFTIIRILPTMVKIDYMVE
jgi:uncharacterized membrane protein